MTKPYEPRGRVLRLIEAMQEDPNRIWSKDEAAAEMGISARFISAHLAYAFRAGAIYRGRVAACVALSLHPFRVGAMDPPPLPENLSRQIARKPKVKWQQPEDDIRIPRVVEGWKPPVMQCVRGGL